MFIITTKFKMLFIYIYIFDETKRCTCTNYELIRLFNMILEN